MPCIADDFGEDGIEIAREIARLTRARLKREKEEAAEEEARRAEKAAREARVKMEASIQEIGTEIAKQIKEHIIHVAKTTGEEEGWFYFSTKKLSDEFGKSWGEKEQRRIEYAVRKHLPDGVRCAVKLHVPRQSEAHVKWEY